MTKNLDDVLKEFEEKANNAQSKFRKLWKDTTADDIYNVDIHIWRKPGMGNSLQTIVGNKISIMTATASYLNTLISQQEFDYVNETGQSILTEHILRKHFFLSSMVLDLSGYARYSFFSL